MDTESVANETIALVQQGASSRKGSGQPTTSRHGPFALPAASGSVADTGNVERFVKDGPNADLRSAAKDACGLYCFFGLCCRKAGHPHFVEWGSWNSARASPGERIVAERPASGLLSMPHVSAERLGRGAPILGAAAA